VAVPNNKNPRSYVSRKAAKIAKVNSMAILSSWRSLRLGESTGFACGRRPRWGLRASVVKESEEKTRAEPAPAHAGDARATKGGTPSPRKKKAPPVETA